MNIFLLNFILMLVEALFLLFIPNNMPGSSKKTIDLKKKAFVVLQCIQWVLISSLRADTVGADTLNYTTIFEMHTELSWKECFEYFKTYYTNPEYIERFDIFDFEPGYILFEKLVATIWNNQIFYKFVVSAIFMTSLGCFVYKNSDDPFLAFLLYCGLFYNMFSLTGYRQVMSVAIGILWSYEYIKQRKFFKFLLLVLLASLLHKTTLVFIVFYFLSRKKITNTYLVCVVIAVAGMIMFRSQLFDLVKGFVGYEEYGADAGFTQVNFLLMFCLLSILAIWRYPAIMRKTPNAHMYYNGLILSAAMIPFAMVSPTAMRLVYDFAFMLMILVPKVFNSFKDKRNATILYVGSILIFGFFIATKAFPYEFFWQVS